MNLYTVMVRRPITAADGKQLAVGWVPWVTAWFDTREEAEKVLASYSGDKTAAIVRVDALVLSAVCRPCGA